MSNSIPGPTVPPPNPTRPPEINMLLWCKSLWFRPVLSYSKWNTKAGHVSWPLWNHCDLIWFKKTFKTHVNLSFKEELNMIMYRYLKKHNYVYYIIYRCIKQFIYIYIHTMHILYIIIRYNNIYPIGSMYGIYTNIGGILMVNVTIYSIHGSYGYIYTSYLHLRSFRSHRCCPVVEAPKFPCDAFNGLVAADLLGGSGRIRGPRAAELPQGSSVFARKRSTGYVKIAIENGHL